MSISEGVFTPPARPRGAGGATRETDSILFDFESAPRGPRGDGEGETRDKPVPGRFPIRRHEQRRDLPCEAVAKMARRSKKTRFYFGISIYVQMCWPCRPSNRAFRFTPGFESYTPWLEMMSPRYTSLCPSLPTTPWAVAVVLKSWSPNFFYFCCGCSWKRSVHWFFRSFHHFRRFHGSCFLLA